MNWCEVNPDQLSEVKEAMVRNEQFCIQITGRKAKEPILSPHLRVLRRENGNLEGTAFLSSNGNGYLIMPSIPIHFAHLYHSVLTLSAQQNIPITSLTTIPETNFSNDPNLQKNIPYLSKTDYYLMVKTNRSTIKKERNRSFIVKIVEGEEEMRKAVDLHVEYLKEELPESCVGRTDSELRLIAYSMLKLETTAGVFYKGKMVAKGSTNLSGETVTQLGGVYTLPSFREKGAARMALECLCDQNNQKGHGTILHVKKDNLRAIRAYQKCGFNIFSTMTIFFFPN